MVTKRLHKSYKRHCIIWKSLSCSKSTFVFIPLYVFGYGWLLQRDIDRLGSWARKWGMRFQPVKCNMMQLTRKRIKKIHASYTLEGINLEKIESIKYLGVTITSDLRWNTNVSNVCTKANRTLGFLRRKLYSCPQEVKEAAYKGLVRPVLDYGSSVWDPPGVVLQEKIESVQKHAARFVTGNYSYENWEYDWHS